MDIFNLFQESEAKAKESEAKAKESEAKAKESEAKAKESEAKAKESEAKAKESEAKAKESEAKAKESEAKAKDNHDLYTKNLHELNLIINSRSWKITWLLRYLNRQFQLLKEQGILKRSKAYIKKIILLIKTKGNLFSNKNDSKIYDEYKAELKVEEILNRIKEDLK